MDSDLYWNVFGFIHFQLSVEQKHLLPAAYRNAKSKFHLKIEYQNIFCVWIIGKDRRLNGQKKNYFTFH